MIVAARKEGISVLLVEQNVRAAVEIADRAYVLDDGSIVYEGPAASSRRTRSGCAPWPAPAPKAGTRSVADPRCAPTRVGSVRSVVERGGQAACPCAHDRIGGRRRRASAVNLVFPHTFVPWFRTVAPHIHAYHGKTFVVAIAGELIAAGKLASFAQDLAILQAMGIKIVLVHGFRPQVDEQLRSKGHAARYSHGLRITDPIALDSAQEAAGQLRFEIEAAFSQGLPNTPMANAIVRVVSGNFLTAQPVGIVDGVDFMHSGIVRKVDAVAIRRAIDIGAMVLLSPFGFSPTGEAFNLTMEDVATSTAIALQADKLLFVTEVRRHPRGPGRSRIADRHRARPGRCREAARVVAAAARCRPTPRSICAIACGPAAAASSARTSCRSRSTARC